MKRVYNCTSIEEAEFLRMALRDHGIDSLLEDTAAGWWGMGLDSAVMLGISVAADQEQEAIAVIREVLDLRKRVSGEGQGGEQTG